MGIKNRREFLASTFAIGAAAVLPLASESTELRQDPLPSLQGRKVLFMYGGWEGHEPEKFRDYLVPWLKEQGATVVESNKLESYADKSLMDTIDLVVQTVTMSPLKREQEKGLIDAITLNGTGIAGCHGGMGDSFRNNTDYQYMTGGQFVSHPGGGIDYTVKIVNKKDSVMQGLKDFKMHSEQYYMHVDPNVKVLATTKFTGQHNAWIEGCVIPVTWKKMHGKGRVFYTSLGHKIDDLLSVPDAMEMLKRGIRWASGSKYLPAEKWVSAVYG
jgi:type 1 glutamine amidotransferase